jgi:transposase
MQGQVLPEDAATAEVYVGCDVSKAYLDVYVHPGGKRLRVSNDRPGLAGLKRALRGRPVGLVVLEATGKYHRLAQRSLTAAGLAVAVVNPLRARLFAEAAGTLAKTDRVDARMLALLGQALNPRVVAPAPQTLETLTELVRARSAAMAERIALGNRLGASTGGWLKAELRRRFTAVQGHIDRLMARIEASIAADPGLSRRRAILLSFPGYGPAVAADLLAELPELGRLSIKATASLAGLAPWPDSSGRRDGPRHIRGGRSQPRRALDMAALAAARCNPPLAAFYKRLRQAGKPAKLALTALMRKLVLLANTLLRQDRLWTQTNP